MHRLVRNGHFRKRVPVLLFAGLLLDRGFLSCASTSLRRIVTRGVQESIANRLVAVTCITLREIHEIILFFVCHRPRVAEYWNCHAQTLSGQESVRSLVAGRNISGVAPSGLPIPARLGFSAVPLVGAHLKSASHSDLPHGLTGGTIGAIVGGAIGWASVRIHCESGTPCPTTRS